MIATTPFVSASQITTFRDECERRWAFRLLARDLVDEPQTDAAKLGDEVDKEQLQPLLRDGRPFDFTRPSGYIAESGRVHLPAPRTPGVEVQRFFMMASPTGVVGGRAKFGYLGYLDLWSPDSSVFPNVLPSSVVVPAVGDFKTMKDPDKWRKDEEKLRVDPQAIIYATWAMLHTGARTVDLVWIYFRTDPKKSPKSLRTYVRLEAPEVVARFREIDEVANRMISLRLSAEGKDPITFALTLPPNPEACEMYGRTCPYAPHCNLGPAEIVEAMAARDRRRRLPVVKEEGSKMSNPTEDFKARLARMRGNTGAAPEPTAAPTFAPPPAPQPLPINPPESALPPAPPIGTSAAAPATPPARRGRPPKAAAAAPAAPPVDAPTCAPSPSQAPPDAPTGKRIGTVFLDSYPVGAAFTTAEELYAKAGELIRAKHGVTDYRLIDFKGSGVFASTLGEVLDGELIPNLVVDTRTPEGAIAKSVCAARASRVVQGCR